jgi:hypothetical protein
LTQVETIRIRPANREHASHAAAVIQASRLAVATFFVVKQTPFRCLDQLKRNALTIVNSG